MNRPKVKHPGVVLLDDFLRPAGVSQNELARMMQVSPRRINEIVLGKRAITAETALGLADTLGMAARYWMGLQVDYDLAMADWRCEERRRRRELRGQPGGTREEREWMGRVWGDDAPRYEKLLFSGRKGPRP